MGLMETLEYLTQICISIQNQLDILISYMGDQQSLNRSFLDLAGIDVASMEKNVALLASYREDIEFLIQAMQKLSMTAQVILYSVISLFALIILFALFENRNKIIKFIMERIKK